MAKVAISGVECAQTQIDTESIVEFNIAGGESENGINFFAPRTQLFTPVMFLEYFFKKNRLGGTTELHTDSSNFIHMSDEYPEMDEHSPNG